MLKKDILVSEVVELDVEETNNSTCDNCDCADPGTGSDNCGCEDF